MSRRQRGHVQELGGDRFRLFVELDEHPITGRRRQATKRITAPSLRDALDELARFSTEVAATPPVVASRTVDDLLDAWLQHLSVDVATSSEWKASLRRYVRPAIGSLPLKQLTAERIDRHYRFLAAEGGSKGAPLAAATIRKAHAALTLACTQGVKWSWLVANPCLSASPPAGPRTTIVPPTAVEVAQLVAAADDDLGCFVRLLAHVGPRREEALAWRWCDVDLEARAVKIHRVVRLAPRMTITDHPKNSASLRTVAISVAMAEQLRVMRSRHRARNLALGVPLDDAYLLSPATDGGRPYHPRAAAARFERLRSKAGLEHVTLHSFRHYMATQALSRGHDPVTVAQRGGWANPNTLLKVYAHYLPARGRDLAEDLG